MTNTGKLADGCITSAKLADGAISIGTMSTAAVTLSRVDYIRPPRLVFSRVKAPANCPNCGAPGDHERTSCAYCGTPYPLYAD